jgi:hypothetical protein
MLLRAAGAIATALLAAVVAITILSAVGAPFYVAWPLSMFTGALAAWPFVNRIKPIPFTEWLLTNTIGWLLVAVIMFFFERPR